MITLRMSDDRRERLDALIREGRYASRAEALTAGLDMVLAEEERQTIDRAIIDGYTRLPPTREEDALAVAARRRSIAAQPG
jgi:Arc/MetJ-type ribon-helix-helix transcriptional regulator